MAMRWGALGKPFGVTDTSAQDCSFESDAGMGMDAGMFDFGGSGCFGDGW